MARTLVLILLIWSFPLLLSRALAPGHIPATEQNSKPLHDAWDILLKKYVHADGQVNYQGFLADSSALNTYLNTLVRHVPDPSSDRMEQLSFYINLYNAATIKLILDHYPVRSIREIKDPWDQNWIPLSGNLRSLGYLEHQVLRKMDEPRIHFAINCASNSCPQLAETAYTATLLESQLEEATRRFIQDTTRNRIGSEHLELSQIFNWYKKDFTKESSLTAYIAPYVPVSINPGAKISFLRYDWNLNEVQ